MEKKQLPVTLAPREISWGIHYLLFQILILGPLLANILPQYCPWLNVDMELIYNLINLVAMFLIYHRFLGRSMKYGFSHWGMLLLITGLGLALYFLVIPKLEDLVTMIKPDITNYNNAAITDSIRANPITTCLRIVFLVPLTEEITYRGLIFGGLRQKNRPIAYIVSILFFSLIHVVGYMESQSLQEALLNLLPYIPASLILTVVYEKSGSILAPSLIHTAVNAFIAIKQLKELI